MGLETFTFIDSLNASNPDGADNVSDGDAHIRGVKTVLLASFPQVNSEVSASSDEMNYLVGVTSAIQTQIDAKAPVASPTFTGTDTGATLVRTGNATIGGSLSVSATAVFTTRIIGVTEAAGTSNTQVATTAFVQTAVAGATGGVDYADLYFFSTF